MENDRIARRLAEVCEGRWRQGYVGSKVKRDPLYEGVWEVLKGRGNNLLDVGCGLGLLGMYLRERGWEGEVLGVDFDGSKIEEGSEMLATGGYEGIVLREADMRDVLPEHDGDVAVLDVLQYISEEKQRELLESAVRRLSGDGVLVIRSGLRKRSLRFFVTWAADVFAKCALWMKSVPVSYPTEELLREVLEGAGLEVDVRGFWGGTPFSNYLIVAKRRKFLDSKL